MNSKSFMEIYRAIHPAFEKYCRNHARFLMPVEDLIHEALIIAYEKRDSVDQNKLLYFLMGTAKRILANAQRKNKPQSYDPLHPIDSEMDSPQRAWENRQWIEMALAKLPETQREAIVLFEIMGYPIKEVAIVQEAKESAVKQRLRRGRESLKLHLAKLIQTK